MSDDDSFNDADDAGHLSDDSFNDEEPTHDVDDDDDEAFDDDAAGAASAAAASASSAAAASSAAVAAPSSSPTRHLAFEVNGRQGDYVIQDESELRSAMEALVKDVASVLHVPAHLASMLLRTHNWNKEKFEMAYFEDSDRLLEKFGLQYMAEDGKHGGAYTANFTQHDGGNDENRASISVPSATETSISGASSSTPSSINAVASASAASQTALCPICFDDHPLEDTAALGCNHRFCNSCLSGYLNTAVNDGKLCIVSRCAAVKCPILVPDKMFQNLTSAEIFQRHQQYLVRSYVEDNRLLRWCPSPRCTYAVRVLNSSVAGVRCRCGFRFCFRCGEEDHAPATCEQLNEWNQKCKNESETAHWIIANTKKCPKCSIRIEKNQGCNHMTCRGCKFEWCWVCNGDWALHGNNTGGYYKCNKWDPKAAAATSAETKPGEKTPNAEQAKAELNRYLHYYQRYHNHDQSKRFAEKQKHQTEKRMATMHAQSGGDAAWIDFEFLAKATAQVLECRSVLKYTYVYAYYLPEGTAEKTLFEYLQQQLESATEHLSELSELPPLEKIDRTQVVNYTRITAQFCKNLLDGVAGGLTQ